MSIIAWFKCTQFYLFCHRYNWERQNPTIHSHGILGGRCPALENPSCSPKSIIYKLNYSRKILIKLNVLKNPSFSRIFGGFVLLENPPCSPKSIILKLIYSQKSLIFWIIESRFIGGVIKTFKGSMLNGLWPPPIIRERGFSISPHFCFFIIIKEKYLEGFVFVDDPTGTKWGVDVPPFNAFQILLYDRAFYPLFYKSS